MNKEEILNKIEKNKKDILSLEEQIKRDNKQSYRLFILTSLKKENFNLTKKLYQIDNNISLTRRMDY